MGEYTRMTHLEAAEKSNRGNAIRYDGAARTCVIYNREHDQLFAQADDEGNWWQRFPVEYARQYRDWQPANVRWWEPLWDRLITFSRLLISSVASKIGA